MLMYKYKVDCAAKIVVQVIFFMFMLIKMFSYLTCSLCFEVFCLDKQNHKGSAET